MRRNLAFSRMGFAIGEGRVEHRSGYFPVETVENLDLDPVGIVCSHDERIVVCRDIPFAADLLFQLVNVTVGICGEDSQGCSRQVHGPRLTYRASRID